MIQTGFDTRIKVQQIIDNQLPEFIIDENPNAAEFLKQYYVSQEYPGGNIDIAENLDSYLKIDNLTPEVINNTTILQSGISSTTSEIPVLSTKGYPQKYGLLQIDNEIITYTGITTNTFTGCIRGFSGITSYHSPSNPEELVFSTSNIASHNSGSVVSNLSALFLKEFYKKIKFTFTPGLENSDFVPELNIGNFIKSARAFYQSKGTKESFRILFNVLYGVTPTVLNLGELLIRPSAAYYLRREEVVAERISGDPSKIVGQTIVKSTDPATTASVSQVEIFTVDNKQYFKLSLFVGYEESSAITGTFTIPGKTRVIDQVPIGSSVISVDSTIGFPQSGTLICNQNIITYSDRSVNQFFGCVGITSVILPTNDIRINETVYAYEDGDLNKKVELRITGVLSGFEQITSEVSVSENEEIYVKNLGQIITDPPDTQKSYKHLVANAWIYNTSSRYQVSSIFGSTFTLSSPIDKSSLKVGDNIEILVRDTEEVVSSKTNFPVVQNIDLNNNQIIVGNNGGFVYDENFYYDIRRKLKKASSTGVPIEFGNDSLTCDVNNVYSDDNTNKIYVASGSLPSYKITKNLFKSTIPEATGSESQSLAGKGYLQGFDGPTQTFSIISFPDPVPFIRGDEVYYLPENDPIPSLNSGIYYVDVISKNQIRLYLSRSFVGNSINYVKFGKLNPGTGSHSFILSSQKYQYVSSQKILREFDLYQNTGNGVAEKTQPGSVGILINGVEIQNYKSNDKVYYGPLTSVKVLNGGNNYDVINPPIIDVTAGAGITAKIQPVVQGSVKSIVIDPQEFDLNTVVSIAITGGNGTGAILYPIVTKRRREISFDARLISGTSGGIDITNDTITFLTNHNLNTGDSLIYDSNGNLPIGISSNSSNNLDQGKYLVNYGMYYVSVLNNRTVQLFNSTQNARSGINTVYLSSANNAGIHKFKSGIIKNTISEVKVVNGGSGYTNRKLIVNPSGISTFNNSINFNNHGFNEKDLIVYDYQTYPIIGLSSSLYYYVSKINDNSFRLCDAGAGGTNTANYNRGNNVIFSGIGSGYQYFSYPKILVNANIVPVGIGTTTGTITPLTATATIRGKIIDAYLYEPGTGYGSNILNLEKKPNVSIRKGSDARFTPIIVDGKIISVNVSYGGYNYYSTPDITIGGVGSGCIIRPVISNGRISRAVVINPGFGYTSTNVSLNAINSGSGAYFDTTIRDLTVNSNFKYGDEVIIESPYNRNLEYTVSGYFESLRDSFNDNNSNNHSPLIGWAYDGNPIYGPFGYSDPKDTGSQVRIINSGYELGIENVLDRPSGFNAGFFAEDYAFKSNGDLDSNNGRFTKTPEFPKGIYAYFAGVTTSPIVSGTLITRFPYFIGNSYRSNYNQNNLILNQEFDFNKSDLIRNTFPYKLNDQFASNDFIIESAKKIEQKCIVKSVTKGSINKLEIINKGQDYRVNDLINFDNSKTGGGGFNATISKIEGKDIVKIDTSILENNNAIISWENENQIRVNILPYHNLLPSDSIVISGLSTAIGNINGYYNIGFSSYSVSLAQSITSSPAGIVTDIFVTSIPSRVTIGSSISIGIGSEVVTVLNIFPNQKALRVYRPNVGFAYSASTFIGFAPDSVLINKKNNYFESRLNDTVYFNPLETVGFGVSTAVGIPSYTTYAFAGITTYIRYVPLKSIYIENHPFIDNQQVTISIPSNSYSPISVSTSFGGSVFTIPSGSISTTVYIANKTKDTIGIRTQLNSPEVFFSPDPGGTFNSYFYNLTSNYPQSLAKVQKIKTTVSTSSTHGLLSGDTIELTVNPNLSVGIGTSSFVRLRYDSSRQNLLVNPLTFGSAGINTLSDTIAIGSHGFVTGDKVSYVGISTIAIASGITTGSYYVYKVDDNNFQLCQTYSDTQTIPPIPINLLDRGGALQQLSLINPQLTVVKNNDLIFDVSHPTLTGYNLRFYYDSEFKNEFVSIGNTTSFSSIGIGTAGISTNAKVSLKYSSGMPVYLYYNLEKSGFISTSDTDVVNGSKILFVDSVYTGTYSISGVGTTSFNISLPTIPEKLSYSASECDNLKYSTRSLTAKGSISAVKILSGGTNYKKLPGFSSITSQGGFGAYISPQSNQIGKVNQVLIVNEGYDYPSDSTLSPTAFIPPSVILTSSNIIEKINVIYPGKYYVTEPDLVLVDAVSGKKLDRGILKANVSSSGVDSVDIIVKPTGIPNTKPRLVAVNNTNGISIDTVITSGSGIVTCYLTTPVLGFSTTVFSTGDLIFVENIQQYGNTGTGYNSKDYQYQFFQITKFLNTNPVQLEYYIPGIGTNPGIAKTSQESLASVSNYKNCPQFEIIQNPGRFLVGEKLIVQVVNQNVPIERNLKVSLSEDNFIKVIGTYDLEVGDLIIGKTTGISAIVNSVKGNSGKFTLNYSTKKDLGWADNTGKISEDFQVIGNNDYYQDMAYTVKSPIQFKDLITPVNNLLHTSGLKNFADTGITSSFKTNILGVTTAVTIIDVLNENRVDTINNFDLTVDYNIANGKSNFLKLSNKKLVNYIQCNTNRVLRVDDISSQFSSLGLLVSDQNNIAKILPNDSYDRFLVQIIDTNKSQFQLTELVSLNSYYGKDKNFDTLEKGTLTNGSPIGNISAFTDDFGDNYLRFDPTTDPYNSDYDIKILRNSFSSIFSGIGSTAIGFSNLIASNISGISSGITTSIVSIATTTPISIYANVQVIDNVTNLMNYAEIYMIYDGNDTYLSDYYFNSDNSRWNLSFDEIGTFIGSVNSGVVSINYTNNHINQNTVRVKSISYDLTSTGIGTFRFILPGQISGLERSARYQTDYSVVSTASSIVSVNRNDITGLKSIIQISVGSTNVLHQVMMLHDNVNTYTLEYPYLSIDSNPGIGTFGGEYDDSGLKVGLKFYPDAEFIGENISIRSFSEILYTDFDRNNTPPDLNYGSMIENISISQYSGINGQRINKTDFAFNYKNTPIFEKVFDPTDPTVLNPVTGVFTIQDHFFSTAEELSYVPTSSFLGVGATSIGIGSTANFAGIVTNILPPKVYPIKITNDTFRLATRPEYATSGIYVTFTSYGEGNAHKLTMNKKLERTVLSIDGVVQYPIAFTPINFNLNNNGGSISVASTFFALTGISSIKPDDILKIDNEYLRIINVGLGSTSIGPITNSGSVPLVNVSRGFVGSSATSHTDSTNARIYRGSYNIENTKVHFTNPPLGNLLSKVDRSNLTPAKSSFDGRVYLRSDYSTNQLYDNISDQFTGIGQTYALTVQGINTTGIGSIGGSGILLINELFQTPTTFNNSLNNYSIQDNSTAGITSVVFSGISSDNGQLIKSDYDYNLNQLPRGGVIISLGSTDGIGYAPLVGASVTCTVDGVGRITSIGIGTTGTWGSGYNFSGSIGIGISDDYHSLQPGSIPAFITANVGAGGTLIFNILNSGDRYTPQARFQIPSPSYSNLPVNIVSRLSTGTTSIPGKGLLLNVNIAAASTSVGAAASYFSIESFKIVRPGYAFQKGDILEPVGLVTDINLPAPLSKFQLTVLDTFTDSFSAWQFGDLDYIDSVKNLQDGVRTRFPLYYNSSLLSFEVDPNNQDSSRIDLNAVLLIFINGVIQDPGTAYQFSGGSSFTFTNPPEAQDKVAIFFYRGTRNTDSIQITVRETIKVGDVVQVFKNDAVTAITTTQDPRLVLDIPASDKIQTNVYPGFGINTKIPKPFSWTKQKIDQQISGQIIYKVRDSIESEIYPTAKIIKDFRSSDTVMYVDDAYFFNYEYNSTAIPINGFDGLLVPGTIDPVGAALTATVDADTGKITTLTVNQVGSGYTGSSISVKIGSPAVVGPGIGTTATATIGITSGSLTGPVTIINPGLGYVSTAVPAVFVPPPKASFDKITGVTNVQGFSGIITGIGTTSGTSGNPLALKFYLNTTILTPFPSGLATGFPIYISNTTVGNGLTSIDNNNSSIVGIGTTFLDNIYYIHNFSYNGTTSLNAEIVCNIDSRTSVVGIATTGTCIGRFSWGVLRGFSRSTSPISVAVSGYTVDSGLTTFPTIQRRGYGLRSLGALKKTF
jgi:hypothetical protein